MTTVDPTLGMLIELPGSPRLVVPPGEEHHDEWLTARRLGIGASDVAGIVGASRWTSPFQVWLDKLALVDDTDNPAMEWGRRLESAILRKFEDTHPELLVTGSPGLLAHRDVDWQLATPDGLAYPADVAEPVELVECKTASSRDPMSDEEWGEPGTDEVPLAYLCQVTWGARIVGARRWHLAVLLDGRDYREYAGEVSDRLAASLVDRCTAFWRDHVQAGIEPPADGSDTTTELLAARHRPTRTTADLPAEALDLARGYRINHEAIAERQAAKDDYGNRLRQLLANAQAEEGYVNGVKVATWKRTKPREVTRVDLDALRRDHPDLIAQYTTTVTEPGQLRLTVPKGLDQ